MIRRSDSGESQSLPNLSPAEVGKLCIKLYLSFPSAFLAEGCAYDLLKEALKRQRLFPPGSSVPCVCFLQSANYWWKLVRWSLCIRHLCTRNRKWNYHFISQKYQVVTKKATNRANFRYELGTLWEYHESRFGFKRVLRWVRKRSWPENVFPLAGGNTWNSMDWVSILSLRLC